MRVPLPLAISAPRSGTEWLEEGLGGELRLRVAVVDLAPFIAGPVDEREEEEGDVERDGGEGEGVDAINSCK